MGDLTGNMAGALARHMRLGSIELMDVFVYRVEEIDPGINAVVVRDFERA